MHDVVAVLQADHEHLHWCSNNSERPSIWEYSGFLIQELRRLSATLAAGFPLRHNSLEIQLAGFCEQPGAVLLEVVQIQNMPNCPRTDEPPQAVLRKMESDHVLRGSISCGYPLESVIVVEAAKYRPRDDAKVRRNVMSGD